jgi:GH24 family phage-related lysozyme (muramidase)
MIDLDFTAAFVAEFEGFVDHVYLDAVGVETIGYGETAPGVIEQYRGCSISRAEALELLKRRIQEFADAVEECITNASALTPERHAALTSFAYNIGVGGFRDSTACKRFNDGDIDGVPEAMSWWDKAGDRVLEGLASRRAAEGALFQQGVASRAVSPSAAAAPAPTSTRVIKVGDRGEDVREAQRRLSACGWTVTVDGIFGPGTADAVRALQRASGLVPDGVLGRDTWQALMSSSGQPAAADGAAPPWPGRHLAQGADGEDVRQAQHRLTERGWALVVDGRFGPKTDGIVRTYQSEKALVVDGVIGPVTWQSLWVAAITGAAATPDSVGDQPGALTGT